MSPALETSGASTRAGPTPGVASMLKIMITAIQAEWLSGNLSMPAASQRACQKFKHGVKKLAGSNLNLWSLKPPGFAKEVFPGGLQREPLAPRRMHSMMLGTKKSPSRFCPATANV
jgi:hypothetical protein